MAGLRTQTFRSSRIIDFLRAPDGLNKPARALTPYPGLPQRIPSASGAPTLRRARAHEQQQHARRRRPHPAPLHPKARGGGRRPARPWAAADAVRLLPGLAALAASALAAALVSRPAPHRPRGGPADAVGGPQERRPTRPASSSSLLRAVFTRRPGPLRDWSSPSGPGGGPGLGSSGGGGLRRLGGRPSSATVAPRRRRFCHGAAVNVARTHRRSSTYRHEQTAAYLRLHHLQQCSLASALFVAFGDSLLWLRPPRQGTRRRRVAAATCVAALDPQNSTTKTVRLKPGLYRAPPRQRAEESCRAVLLVSLQPLASCRLADVLKSSDTIGCLFRVRLHRS